MDAVLGGCGLHVCASDVEGWGQVVIDAASHGIPTVGRDVPGLRDSIVDGSTGWLVDAGGDDPLVDLLAAQVRGSIEVLSDPDRQREYADRCRDVGRALHLGPDARRGRAGHHGSPARPPATGRYY